MNNDNKNMTGIDDETFPLSVAGAMAEAVRAAPLDPMAERFLKSRLMTRVRDFERGAVTNTILCNVDRGCNRK